MCVLPNEIEKVRDSELRRFGCINPRTVDLLKRMVSPKKSTACNLYQLLFSQTITIVLKRALIEPTHNTLHKERIVTLQISKIGEFVPTLNGILLITLEILDGNPTFDSNVPKLSLSLNTVDCFTKVESRHAWRTFLDFWFGRVEVTYILPKTSQRSLKCIL
jgi:hypothetical protein